MGNDSSKKPLIWTGKKVDSARALIARGWGVSLVSRCLRVSRAQLHVILRRTDDWMDGRRNRHHRRRRLPLLRIHHVIGAELPTNGHRRALGAASQTGQNSWYACNHAKRVDRLIRQNALLLEQNRRTAIQTGTYRADVAVKTKAMQRWCSDGFEFRRDNGGEVPRCHVRAWTAL